MVLKLLVGVKTNLTKCHACGILFETNILQSWRKPGGTRKKVGPGSLILIPYLFLVVLHYMHVKQQSVNIAAAMSLQCQIFPIHSSKEKLTLGVKPLGYANYQSVIGQKEYLILPLN